MTAERATWALVAFLAYTASIILAPRHQTLTPPTLLLWGTLATLAISCPLLAAKQDRSRRSTP